MANFLVHIILSVVFVSVVIGTRIPEDRRKVTKPVLIAPYPLNTTLEYGGNASLLCKVQSVVQPHILWLRRVEDSNEETNASRTIVIMGQRYVVLKASPVWIGSDGSYLNRLNINRATDTDAGMYICIGANVMGYNVRSAFLTVVGSGEIDGDNPFSESHKTDGCISEHLQCSPSAGDICCPGLYCGKHMGGIWYTCIR